MSLRISNGSLLSFLSDRADDRGETIDPAIRGRCLLAGNIARRNLSNALARRGIDDGHGFETATIESTAAQLLSNTGPATARTLDRDIRLELLADIIDAASRGPAYEALGEYLAALDLTDDLRERFLDELDAYYRASDAGADRETLRAVAASLDDPFSRRRSLDALDAFDDLTRGLEERTSDLEETYVSRSHLVRAARRELADRWAETFPDVEWVAVATISVFDNPTLRFLEALDALEGGPEIYVFLGRGTRDALVDRFEAVGMDVAEARAYEHDRKAVVPDLLDAAEGDPPTNAADVAGRDDVRFLEAPERRREVEQVVKRAAALVNDPDRECELGDVLVVARDAGSYRSTVADVCTTHGFPYHVETRRPVAQTVSYRYLKAVLDLLEATAAGDPVDYWELIDPIRLGFCPPGRVTLDWPMDDAAFLALEERLYADQADAATESAIETGAMTVDAWRETVASRRGDAWERLEAFLDWTARAARDPPTAGDEIGDLLRDLLESHVVHTATLPMCGLGGPSVDTARTDLGRKHRTELADRLRDRVAEVGAFFDECVETDLAEPGWSLAGRSLGGALGTDSFGVSNADANALRVVDAANAAFLDAKHVFVIGAGTDEFPAAPSGPTFVHRDLYEAVRRASRDPGALTDDGAGGDAIGADRERSLPYLYYPARDDQFRQDLDAYEASLTVARESVTVARHYRDAQGDAVAWSPFVDALPIDEFVDRVRLSDWLPGPGWYGSWAETTMQAPMRDRLRLALYHVRDQIDAETVEPRLAAEGIETEADLVRLATSVDGEDFVDRIAPRHERFSAPITSVAVDPAESAYEAGPTVDDVVGEPVRAHELDVHARCPLQYYFSQYLFGVNGDEVSRDREAAEPDGPRVYERTPATTTLNYAARSDRAAMAAVVDRHLPDRSDLASYRGPSDLRDAVAEWVETDDAVDWSVFQPLLSEYFVVRDEQRAGVTREWRWTDGPTDLSVRGTDVRVPDHRVDRLPAVDGEVRVFATGEAGRARVSIKRCFEGGAGDAGLADARPSDADEICRSCDRADRCTLASKHTHDHRARAVAVATDAAGVTLVDPGTTRPTGRQSAFREDVAETVSDVDREAHAAVYDGGSWSATTSRWRSALGRRLSELTDTDSPLEYEQSLSFARNGGCEGCAYRDLCGVPRHVSEGGERR